MRLLGCGWSLLFRMASFKPVDASGCVNATCFTVALFERGLQTVRRSQGIASTFDFDTDRIRYLNHRTPIKGARILYWATRDFRLQDNWAMIYSQRLALEHKVPVTVCFMTKDDYAVHKGQRQIDFLCEGLEKLRIEMKKANIDLIAINATIPEFADIIRSNAVAAIITDFNPLRQVNDAQHQLGRILNKEISLIQVDAHNIVPAWLASDKQEYMAKTLRPKINEKLDEFLVGFPEVDVHPYYQRFKCPSDKLIKIQEYRAKHIDSLGLPKLSQVIGGADTAMQQLHLFLTEKLEKYGIESREPKYYYTSGLSPWLNCGFISAHRVALEVKNYNPRKFDKQIKTYLEELIIRRELADNYCFYNRNYDNFEGAPDWAKKTLLQHARDPRTIIYPMETLRTGDTADIIWNAAQRQMIEEGKMHGYLRMYWAKKILEWTETPQQALEVAIQLNDTYAIDGNDPNGYVGVMWSICGVHDQGFKERKIYGKIRFMADYQLQKKFDMATYCGRYKLRFQNIPNPSRKRKHD